MMWILIVPAAALAAIILMALVGAALPRTHLVSRSVRLRASPRDIWRILTDPGRYPSWREGVKAVDGVTEEGGRLRWREHTRFGSIPFEREEAVEPRRLVARIADSRLPFGGRWIYELEAGDGGTVVTITEEGEVRNPLFRFLGRFVFGQARTIEGFLTDLEREISK